MRIFINSFIFLIYILLIFPYQTSSAFMILHYEKEMNKIKVIAKKVMDCESEGKHHVWGDLNYKYPAYGIGQFQYRTFKWLSSISGKKNLKWKRKKDQIELMHWALENGYGNLWTCFRIINKKEKIFINGRYF